LRWHLHELEPTLQVPLGALDRAVWLDRLGRQLARRDQTTQVRIARDLLGRCRTLTRSITELDRELHTRTQTLAPRLLQAARLRTAERSQAALRDRPNRPLPLRRATRTPAGVAPLDASSGKHQRHRLDRGGNRQLNCALHRIAITQGRVHPPARAYLERKQAEGKTRHEAIRCHKRQLARTIYTTLKNDPLLT
jgi:hypothetical protein